MSPNSALQFTSKIVTIERYVLDQERGYPEATGDLTALMYDLALAGKIITSHTSRAGLADILGSTGEENIQGETVQKLDVLADRTLFRLNDHTGRVAVMASEEHPDILPIPDHHQPGKYVLLYDPLDGSSNIDSNVSIGTIFAIYRRLSPGPGPGTLEDCLQPGRNLVAAGYMIYGSSTMMVYSAGQGVHGFTYDPRIGEFLLSHPDMRFPQEPKYYSVNQGYEQRWSPQLQDYTRWLQGYRGKGLSLRYIGSLVADFHRNLLSGGVFYYPAEAGSSTGKLRLAYEAAPLSFLAQQAGGYGSDGTRAILDIQPQSLHQRTSLFIGNRDLVEEVERRLAS